MIETLDVMPSIFWVVAALLGGGLCWSAWNVSRGIGIPVLAVLLTIIMWYGVDALYNDYEGWYMLVFPPEVLVTAWEQVAIFLAAFLLLTPLVHNGINRAHLQKPSQALCFLREGAGSVEFQRGLTMFFFAAFGVWLCLLVGAVFRFKGDFFYYLSPLLGKHPGPWVTTGLGGGKDSLFALANYLQLMVGSLFGLVAALSNNPSIRAWAVLGVMLTWPYYILDRTRKFILVIAVPGLVAWVLFRLRGHIASKLAIFAMVFLFINAWFGFIIANRLDSSITTAVFTDGFNLSESSTEKHQGLNMYEELAWIILLESDGTFSPNWGGNYFANLVNPIPRSLWRGKPTIGLDYAIARGMGGADTAAGVYATLSHGIIGQGVVNFGLYIGPIFAALLLSLWASWLARLDLLGLKIGYLPLYMLGLILTFTSGRDITFLELYPFVFGFGICWWLNRKFQFDPENEPP